VVIYDGMYSGTWQHGAVKGHLFGTIESADGGSGDGKQPGRDKGNENGGSEPPPAKPK
jgi:hypothetical protein